MSDFMSHFAVPAAIGAVAIVLLLGLLNMMRGGSPNRSQKLMRMRVLLQFVAIVGIMAAVGAMQKAGAYKINSAARRAGTRLVPWAF